MDHCIEYLTLFLSCFGCLLLCVRISTPIVNYETSCLEISENSAILECCLECSLEQLHSRKSAGVWSVLSRTLRIFWQERLRRTLQNFPECLKVWSSEKFWRASGVQKKGFPNLSPAAGFFHCGGTENR